MKKVLRSLIVASLCIVSIASANAQNRCVVSDNKNFFSEMQVSDNQTVEKVNNNQIVVLSKPKRNLIRTEGGEVYTLTITPEGEWERIIINNDDGFVDYGLPSEGPIYQREVSEGLYDIVIYYESYSTVLAYDQFEITSDTLFTPSYSEATNLIHFNLTDESNSPITELPINPYSYDVETVFVMSHGTFTASVLTLSMPNGPDANVSTLYFNNFGNRSAIYNFVRFNTTEQQIYCIQLPTITEGMTSDTIISNHPEELVVHKEFFNINNSNNAGFSCNFLEFGPLPGAYNIWRNYPTANNTYGTSEPLMIISNLTNSDEPIIEDSPTIKFMIVPTVWESFDPYHFNFFNPELTFHDALAPFGLALNMESQIVCEPFDFHCFRSSIWPACYPYWVPQTPAIYVYEPIQNLIFGYRTPLLYNQPINYNTQTSPWGAAFFGGYCSYLGESGVQRMKDEDCTLKITYNGEIYFEDSLYLANATVLNFVDAGAIAYDIVNNNVVVDGVAKTNISHIEFDMNRNDAQPPTLNLLQVMDAYNEEVVTIQDLEHSKINFAGGDYHVDIELNWNMVYEGEAIIEAFYKTESSEYQPFEFEEKPEMFHVNYGNYYEIPLSQLSGHVSNEWVTVKFVLSDMAGNSQTQELFNLFYVDDQTSISENHGLQHVVYPNPFTNEVKITAAQAVEGEANLAVYNVLGEQIYSKTESCTEVKEFTIDGNTWKPGVYFYSISTEDGLLQGKIIKE